MKRIYLLMILLVAGAGSVFAQRTINLEAKINQPTANQTLTVGTSFNVEYVFTNKGTGSLMVGDTVLFQDAANQSGQAWIYLVKSTKNTNDTMLVKKSYTISSGTNGSGNWCIVTAMLKGSANTAITDNDTSNGHPCVAVKITGGNPPAGVAQFTVNESVVKENLTITPNPATGDVTFNFTANSNTEVTAKVLDMTGRVVYTRNYGSAYVGQTGYTLNVSELNQGIYFVELSQDGRRAVGKLVKQ